jgi:hypothetical protein
MNTLRFGFWIFMIFVIPDKHSREIAGLPQKHVRAGLAGESLNSPWSKKSKIAGKAGSHSPAPTRSSHTVRCPTLKYPHHFKRTD